MKVIHIIAALGLCAASWGADRPSTRPGENQAALQHRAIMRSLCSGKRLVFVVDEAGRMLTLMGRAKDELSEMIAGLDRDQSFGIIAGADARLERFPKKGLAKATESNQTAAGKFLEDLISEGRWDPAAAIAAALQSKPQAIVLFEDCSADFDVAVLDKALKSAPKRGFTLNIVAMVDSGQMDPKAVGEFTRLTNAFGGKCVFVDNRKP